MNDLTGLELLGLVCLAFLVGGGTLTLAAMRGSFRARAPTTRRTPLELAAPVLRITSEGHVEATPEARALLGVGEEVALRRDALLAGLKAGRDALETALTRLVAKGAAFREVVETRDGRILEASGAPLGIDVSVTLHDQTCLWRRLDAAERRADAAERALADLAAAREAAGLVAWRAGDTEYGAAALDPHVRAALEAAAETLDTVGARERVIVEPQSDSAEAVYAVIAARGGLFVALDDSSALSAERSMSRFVDTISETFAHLKVGLMIFDAERRLSLFNPVISTLCDDDTEWLARRPRLRDLLDRMRRARALPEQPDYAAWRARLLGRVGAEIAAPIEETWHLPDGRTLIANFRPHLAGGLAFVLEDVTDTLALRRINAIERAARDATTEMLEEGIAVFGPDGRLRMANGAFRRLWGFEDGALRAGDHVDGVIAACRAASGPHPFWEEMKGAAAGGLERRATAESVELKNGGFLSARVSPMPDGATLAVFSDVTASERVAAALKERNEALEQTEEMRGALVDQISHQMRTPLNSIFGFGQLLEDGRIGPLNARQADYVRGIVASSGDLIEAIDAMADLISVGADARRESRSFFNPAVVAREAAALAERRTGRSVGDVEIVNDDTQEETSGHRARFRQIVFNMAMDALEKTSLGGRIKLSVWSEGRDVLLECSHEIVEELVEQGVALTLVRRFARLDGGEVKVGRGPDGRRVVRCRITADDTMNNGREHLTEALAQRARAG
ncbi:PAS domain-containing protein [Pikeienuella piscinae]|uniref:histidine kinase n=1 Tax=Pikeienuella piscinae TaxID=2748098 RepID=A0A7L5C069_9RHOB|nr:PAS-domain containing protein [Pikeienuella piscinae]QIE57121.1 PAS domain-containing protein [Pikeienuella piscinae]